MLLYALVLLAIGFAFVAWVRTGAKSPPGPPVTILPGPYMLQATDRDRFLFSFNRNSRWVSRAENLIFGPRKSVNVFTDLFAVRGELLTNFGSTMPLGEPVFTNANGLGIWFPKAVDIELANWRLARLTEAEVLSHPRVVAAEGFKSSVFMGQSIPIGGATNDIGFTMECSVVPGAPKDLTELALTIIQTEITTNAVVRTNLNVSAHLRIPKGCGVVILDGAARGAGEKGFGMIINPPQ